MSIIMHRTNSREISAGGESRTVTWVGTEDEMRELQLSMQYNALTEFGRVRRTRVSQYGGSLWSCEVGFVSGTSGTDIKAPSGKLNDTRSELRGVTLSMPLESHPDYRAAWNHFLAASPSMQASPSWALERENTQLSIQEAECYAWIDAPGDVPTVGGQRWRIVVSPEMPGVTSYDVATYTVVETTLCRSASEAGSLVANTLNRTGYPRETFGITGGNWKCDDAGVAWNGSVWVATLTWTKSGGDRPWNSKLYKSGGA